MKTVKTILKAALLITLLSFASCSSDDDDQGGNPVKSNSYKVDGGEYATPNLYLIIDGSGTNYDSDYTFMFTDKIMREDATNGVSMSTDTNQFSSLSFDNGGASVSSITAVTNQITVGSHPLDDDTEAGFNISNWNDTYMYNSQQFGVPVGYVGYDLESSFSGAHLNIESITIDVAARTGTINCTYVFYSYSTGVPINGEYEGTFTILNDSI